MGFGDPLADGETEPGAGALARAGAGGVGAPEAVEDVRQVARRDADARIRDGEGHAPIRRPELQAHAAARGRVFHRVGEQVEDELTDAARIHGNDHGVRRCRDLHVHRGLCGEELAGFARLLDDRPQIDGLPMQRGGPLVRAREHEQRLHELGHAVDLLERLLERRQRLGWQAGHGDGALDPGAEHGERGLELVARVGGEAAQRREAPLEPRHHLIEGLGEPPQLVLDHRLRESPVQAAPVGDLADLGDDPVHGREGVACDPRPHQQRGHEAERQDQRDGGEQLLGAELGAAQVRAGEDCAELGAGVGHIAQRVVELRPVGLELQSPRRPARNRGGGDQPQLLHLLEGQGPRVRGGEQQAPVARGDDEIVGDGFEQRREVGDQHRTPRGVAAHQHAAGPVALGEDPAGERRFGLDALVEVLIGGGAPGAVQHGGEGGEGQRQRDRVPGREPPADRLHLTPSRRSPRPARCG